MPEMFSPNLTPSAVGNYSWTQCEKLCCKSSCLRWAALSSAIAPLGDTSVGFKVGIGYFIINDTECVVLHLLLLLCKSVLVGAETQFLVLAFFLPLMGSFWSTWTPACSFWSFRIWLLTQHGPAPLVLQQLQLSTGLGVLTQPMCNTWYFTYMSA